MRATRTARTRRVVLPLVLCLVGGGGVSLGYLLGRPVADAPLPPPAPPTTVVEQRRLADEATLTCRARAATQNLAFTPAEGETAIVTHTRREPTLRPGALIAEVSGRPVVALRGPFALYRDIGPGDRGRDVRMLQGALTDIGIETPHDGVYGAATARSVRSLYNRLGYVAPTTPTTPPAAGASPGPTSGSAAQTLAPSPTSGMAPRVTRALRGELVFVADLPLAWAGRAPAVGARITDSLGKLRVPTGALTCTSDRSGDIRPGTVVALGSARGKVTGITAGAGGSNVSPTVTVAMTAGTPAQGETTGTITLAQSDPRALVVPLTALGGGTAPRVVVVGATQREVPVTVSAVIGGYAALTPVAPGSLKAGDHVLVTSS